MTCEITEDRAVASPFLQCPVIHADHLRRSGDGERCRTHEPQQGQMARRHPEAAGETSARFATERQTNLCECSD
jgi:hypothetical protein